MGGFRVPGVDALPPHMREQAMRQLAGTSKQPTAPGHTTEPEKRKRRGKYDAKPVTIDKIRFDSTAEGRHYEKLKLLVAAGEIKRFHRQVIFDLMGVTYRCDFLVVELDDTLRYQDVKGAESDLFKVKRKQVRQAYGVEIEIVRSRKPRGKEKKS